MMFEILVMDVTRSRKTQAHVEECISKGVCLCGCGKKATKRGLAQNCYYEWKTSRNRLNKREQAAYDAKLRKLGQLLESHEVRNLKKQSIFTSLVREVS